MNMKIGSYLKIGIGNGTEKEFLITGTFLSMEGKVIMMNVDAMKSIDSKYEPDNCFITLNDKNDFGEFKNDIVSKYNDVDVNEEWTALKSAVTSIESMLSNIMKIMLIIFIIFAVMSIINILSLTISGKRKEYGILKSLGFSTRYIISQNLCHIITLLFIYSSILSSDNSITSLANRSSG